MSRFGQVSSALSFALSQIKDDIKTVPVKPKQFHKKVEYKNQPKKQYINGNEVKWENVDGTKVPFIQTETFYVSYPSKNEDIKDVPPYTKMATYNSEKGCVEYYGSGEEPISVRYNQKFTGLPYPRFMSGLETVEEVYLVNLETGELTVDLKINILDEYSHWLLRLKEFESQSKMHGIKQDKIDRRMSGFIKNLKSTRGVDILDPKNKIPDHLLSAIEFVKQKQAVR